MWFPYATVPGRDSLLYLLHFFRIFPFTIPSIESVKNSSWLTNSSEVDVKRMNVSNKSAVNQTKTFVYTYMKKTKITYIHKHSRKNIRIFIISWVTSLSSRPESKPIYFLRLISLNVFLSTTLHHYSIHRFYPFHFSLQPRLKIFTPW